MTYRLIVSVRVRSDDIFPLGDNGHAYWAGYFTSRPSLKRQGEHLRNPLTNRLAAFRCVFHGVDHLVSARHRSMTKRLRCVLNGALRVARFSLPAVFLRRPFFR